ncbi:Cuticle Protein CPR RR Uncl [Hyalella azteca]|uniref:Cuticle Protein CPR RR Uncl n=1 Tax=Hyalella azteca TaxID=294128 RepID=A0A6A0H7U8_HYAAZ|nr:cuticle protein CP575-like [Hyalella azteca]KAA0201321.1 Cuticle Protein CPR RR Uncl [Hyalella azteca]
MKFQILLLLVSLAAFVAARPNDILDFESDQGEHEQEGVAGSAVEGEYKWTSPDGEEHYVKYVADRNGYRVLDTDALPSAPEPVEAEEVEEQE